MDTIQIVFLVYLVCDHEMERFSCLSEWVVRATVILNTPNVDILYGSTLWRALNRAGAFAERESENKKEGTKQEQAKTSERR